MHKYLILISLAILTACGGGMTSKNTGSYAVEDGKKTKQSSKASHSSEGGDNDVQTSVAVIDAGIAAGDDVTDLSFKEPTIMANAEKEKILRTKEISEKVQKLKNKNVAFTVYFDFDSTEITEKSLEEIKKHADFLQANPTFNIRLEGHADERGSREYNLALGENRGLSVKEILNLYNIKGVRVVSYGEEKPVDKNHNEAAWKKNRRVEFIYH